MSHSLRLVLKTTAGFAGLAILIAGPAFALDITPTFDSSITGASNAAEIEGAIDAATSAIASNFSNPFNVNILFEAVHGENSFLSASESSFYGLSYSEYTSLLAGAAAANPANAVLNSAVANLSVGNQGGTLGMAVTNTVLEALGVPSADVPGGFDQNGNYTGDGPIDGVVFLNIDAPLAYSQPVPAYDGGNLTYDATRALEHDIDEILGGGGSGSTLNAIADYGLDNPEDPITYYEGALDLYRYSAPGVPSFTTDPDATAYLSVDGGLTSLVGFNQDSSGDFGDFGPNANACGSAGGIGGPAGLIQDAFTCYNETGEKFTRNSPEYAMLEAIGYDGIAAPELATWAMMAAGFLGLAFAGRRRAAPVRGVERAM